MADGIGLPDLGIGWEATCDVSSMRIPGSQATWGECLSAMLPPLMYQALKKMGRNVVQCCPPLCPDCGLMVEHWTDVKKCDFLRFFLSRGHGFETRRSHNSTAL